ncbi:hypothetical protein MIS46_10840 [Wielerella bovis]|uniref:hypothetical protein n=1 Tax=Wielerella bovis TaxID=2917790 RepID=UPI002019336C|nr:hypothetical protein [Wielerella bovis]ULJ62429.1 hypothetical protein MIS46_10840 [Wielerella bovis]
MLEDLKNEIKEITTAIKEVVADFAPHAVFIVQAILALALWYAFPKISSLTEKILAENYTSNSQINPNFRITVQDNSSGKIIYLTDYNKQILYIPKNQEEQIPFSGDIKKLDNNVIQVGIKQDGIYSISRYKIGKNIQPLYFVQHDFGFTLLMGTIIIIPIKLLFLFIKLIKLIFRQPERKTTS